MHCGVGFGWLLLRNLQSAKPVALAAVEIPIDIEELKIVIGMLHIEWRAGTRVVDRQDGVQAAGNQRFSNRL